MGVSGSGKSTVGAALATRLGVDFADADAFHSAADVAKMRAGHPLDDADRAPWLASVAQWLGAHQATGGVIACSALRRRYRDTLRQGAQGSFFLHLDGDPAVISRRMSNRQGHFMPPSLLSSQLETLERLQPDEYGVTVDLDEPIEQILDRVTQTLGQSTASMPPST